jgi:hypothetical protein
MVNHQTRWDSNTPDMPFESHARMILDDIESIRQVRGPYSPFRCDVAEFGSRTLMSDL